MALTVLFSVNEVLLPFVIALATFVSEDLAALTSGVLAANGSMRLWEAVFASFAGIFLGDILLVLAGRFLGGSALLRRFAAGLPVVKAASWLDRRGIFAVLLSRFVPGTRLPLYLAIGFTRRPLPRFFAAFAVACLLWTPLIVGLGFFLDERGLRYLASYNASAFFAFFLLCCILMVLRKIILPLFSWRGRRLLYSSWLRFTRWEFWPPWLFYIPVGFYFVFLAVRYRSLTVFTAANPAIPAGGVIGESKAAILTGLSAAKGSVAPFVLLRPGTVAVRMQALSDFLRRRKLAYPVVLKPDAGERGNGVAIVYSAPAAMAYLAAHSSATIVQEYIPGLEFGVFYVRYPDADAGRIFAITDKRFPQLIGDGRRPLEELILSDPRAVTMARFHLKKFGARLADILPRGEKLRLVELGTHCKGSLFLDGMHLLTKKLETRIDAISRAFDGFFFGRYDIRVPSLRDFQNGRNIRIVELNGVTSEATSIYDPKHSLWHAYRVLGRQWQIAFEIGRRNAARGAKVTPVSDLLRRIFLHRSE